MEDPKDQVLFAKCLLHEEALVLMGALESEGIDAFLKTENLGGHIPGGVNNYIFVPEKDLVLAKKVQAEIGQNLQGFTPVQRKIWPRRILIASAWFFSLSVIGAAGFNVGRLQASRGTAGPIRTGNDGSRYYETDTDEDGQSDARNFIDKEGRNTESRFDRNHDGTDDLVRHYDSDGHLVLEQQDTDNDGKMDRWDDVDKEGRTIHAKLDLDGDGSADSETWYDEDENPRKTIILRDGKVAEEDLFEAGLIRSSIVDTNRDGEFDTEIRYDDYGIFVEARRMKTK